MHLSESVFYGSGMEGKEVEQMSCVIGIDLLCVMISDHLCAKLQYFALLLVKLCGDRGVIISLREE